MTAVVIPKDQEGRLKDKYDKATLIKDWLRMIHEQTVLLRLGAVSGHGQQTLVGGIDVLQFLVGDFWEAASLDVEEASNELKENGVGWYVDGGKK